MVIAVNIIGVLCLLQVLLALIFIGDKHDVPLVILAGISLINTFITVWLIERMKRIYSKS